jgi:uncharacterized membrane protein YfcA
MYHLILLLVSVFAGLLGSLLGLGGGIIIVPMLTLGLNVDIRYAIAASLISIIATSSGAAASFLKDHLTNVRVAVLLELGTVTGAIVGFFVSIHIKSSLLFQLFGFFLLFSSIMMFRKKEDHPSNHGHPWSSVLQLNSSFPGPDGKSIPYLVANVPFGILSMIFAGAFSAILGIGSGIFKVMAMDGAMKLPLKVSSATSNFMIGVTASASAGAYLLRGDIRPEIASPVAIGVIIGSWFGSRIMLKMSADKLRKLFVLVLTIVSIQMILKGVRS